jgi:polysaccharide deacetylase family protein (PEP-CTERM system associated)
MSIDAQRPLSLVTVDVEESFHIEAARAHVSRATWDDRPSRVQASVEWLLQTLADASARATFFTLGWIARRHPRLVERIARQGHEVACHGHLHDRLHRLDPRSFADDLRLARAALRDAAGVEVRGYRAPTFSVTRATRWAVDVLIDQGFDYDSSIQPTRHPQYGVIDSPGEPYRLIDSAGRSIAELPPLTWRLGPLRLPVAGGGYFRLFPLQFMLQGVRQARAAGRPAMLYFHPWEFDPDQPRLPLPRLNRLRTYQGLRRARPRFQSLLKQVRSTTVSDWLATQSIVDWPTFSLSETTLHPQRRAA